MKEEKIIGILGGMGPEATASLYMKIIESTPVTKDQDHLHTIIDSNPKIPDRTQAILYGGVSPVEEMIKTANNLEKAGATLLVMPCITAHYFYKDIQKETATPIFHVLEGVKEFLFKHYPEVKKIGILSTTATKETGLFQKVLSDTEVFFPNKEVQEKNVMEAIYGDQGIKKGNKGMRPKNLLKEAANLLIQEHQCELIIAGCTEIELALKPDDLSVPLIDPMLIAAEALVI